MHGQELKDGNKLFITAILMLNFGSRINMIIFTYDILILDFDYNYATLMVWYLF